MTASAITPEGAGDRNEPAGIPAAAISGALERVAELVALSYAAVVDACDEGYAPEFASAGRPLADALKILRLAVAA